MGFRDGVFEMTRTVPPSSRYPSASFVPIAVTLATVATLATNGGCVPTFDDDLSSVERPRILAVQATPAEARPGERVELSALVAGGDGVEVPELRWALCHARKPLTELGPAAQECLELLGRDEEILEPLGSGLEVGASLPDDACRQFGPDAPFADDGTLAGRPVDPDVTGGYHQPVVVGGAQEGAEGLGAVLGTVRLSCGARNVTDAEAIRFNAGYRPNENPAMERLEITRGGEVSILEAGSGESVRVSPGERVELRVVWPECPTEPVCGDGMCTAGENQVTCAEDCRDAPRGCAGAESYLWANPETRRVEERREAMSVAWYATGGAFEHERTGRSELEGDEPSSSNRWVASSRAGTVQVWIVLRDERGGVGWARYLVEVGG